MKIAFAFAAALLLSATAASAQTPATSQSRPTVNGSTSPQSAPPAQDPSSLGTLPAQNTQPAADQQASTRRGSGQRTKDMKKPRNKQKSKSATTTSSY